MSVNPAAAFSWSSLRRAMDKRLFHFLLFLVMNRLCVSAHWNDCMITQRI